ncbi:MAG: hypothetical protein IKP47_00505 [Ruminococcus sp.]|nr:hypothetical protein [Ruminococcus sp.]
MKTTDEMLNSLYERREQYYAKQKEKRTKALRVTAACAGAAAVAGFAVWQFGSGSSQVKTDDGSSVAGIAAETSGIEKKNAPAALSADSAAGTTTTTAAVTSSPEITEQTTTTAVTSSPDSTETTTTASEKASDIATIPAPVPDDSSYAMGGGEYFFIPCAPIKDEVELTGEAITEAEAKAYFDANSRRIAQNLGVAGVDIAGKGWSYLGYRGDLEKGYEVRQDIVNYPVYSGGSFAGLVTLTKLNGVLSDTVSVPSEGSWPERLGRFLEAHKGEELVFVCPGFNETVIAPDGSMESMINGNEYFKSYAEYAFEGIEDPYARFYHTEAVYVP